MHTEIEYLIYHAKQAYPNAFEVCWVKDDIIQLRHARNEHAELNMILAVKHAAKVTGIPVEWDAKRGDILDLGVSEFRNTLNELEKDRKRKRPKFIGATSSRFYVDLREWEKRLRERAEDALSRLGVFNETVSEDLDFMLDFKEEREGVYA